MTKVGGGSPVTVTFVLIFSIPPTTQTGSITVAPDACLRLLVLVASLMDTMK